MDFYLDNGLLMLAQQIAQDQKDLYSLEEIQYKNEVQRHDYSHVSEQQDQGQAEREARMHGEE